MIGELKAHTNLLIIFSCLLRFPVLASSLPILRRVDPIQIENLNATTSCQNHLEPKASITLADGRKYQLPEPVFYWFEPPPEFDPNDADQVESALQVLTPTIFKSGDSPVIFFSRIFSTTLFVRRLDSKLSELMRTHLGSKVIEISGQDFSGVNLNKYFGSPMDAALAIENKKDDERK